MRPVVTSVSVCGGEATCRTVAMDDDIMARIAKGCTAFDGLQHRLWREHGVSLKTKVEVYRAVVLTTLLFGSECWTLYRKHIKQLEQFQKLPGSDGRTVYQIRVCWRCVAFRVLKHSCNNLSSIGSAT